MAPGHTPCASCKLLRRRCAKDCIFAPYFPSNDPHKFAIVHKVFGASNVSKMLQELPVHQRADAVSSLVYEANARMRDPVYGCVGAISYLQSQVSQLQMQLAMAQAQAEILCIQMQQEPPAAVATHPAAPAIHDLQPAHMMSTLFTDDVNSRASSDDDDASYSSLHNIQPINHLHNNHYLDITSNYVIQYDHNLKTESSFLWT